MFRRIMRRFQTATQLIATGLSPKAAAVARPCAIPAEPTYAAASDAMRIQQHAIERLGVLLKQIESSMGRDRRSDQQDGDDPLITREQAATDAGLSKHQCKTALGVASIPSA